MTIGTAILGPVAIVPKGSWDSLVTYTKLNLVFYEVDGNSYLALADNINVIPSADSNTWMKMTENAGIADGSVTTNKIADEAVTLNKMGDNSVGTNQIINSSITSEKLASGAGGHIIEYNDTQLTQRNILDFINGVMASDDNTVGSERTLISLDIDGLTLQSTIADVDELVFSDISDSNIPKKITALNLKNYFGTNQSTAGIVAINFTTDETTTGTWSGNSEDGYVFSILKGSYLPFSVYNNSTEDMILSLSIGMDSTYINIYANQKFNGTIYVFDTSSSVISYPISIANGGTGASTVSGARESLGLGNLATLNTTDVLTISAQALTLTQQIQAMTNIGVPTYKTAGSHNASYRGKNLGESVSSDQYSMISNGTFDDLYIGDYWNINSIIWRIWHLDYYYNVGDTNCVTHHVTLVPDVCLAYSQMNATDITTGAYVGSVMYTTNLAVAKSTINTAFSGHILNHRVLLANATSSGIPSNWAWYDSTIELMSESQVYGMRAWGGTSQNGFSVASQDGIFAAAVLNHSIIHNRGNYWLQDVASSTYFSSVNGGGHANRNGASNSFGVRPAFSICA